MRKGAGTLGMALSVLGPSGSVYFDQLIVPDLEPEQGQKVLFLDMLEVGALNGLVESFHPMQKHPANPVLRPGPAGSWEDKRAIAYGEVLQEEGRFRMWYAGIDRSAPGIHGRLRRKRGWSRLGQTGPEPGGVQGIDGEQHRGFRVRPLRLLDDAGQGRAGAGPRQAL